MKCELCHQADAETVLYRTSGAGRREELYVCRACAEREQVFDRERGIQVTAMDPDGTFRDDPSRNSTASGEPASEDFRPQELLGRIGEMISRHFSGEDGNGDDLRCPACGASFNDLRNGGLMGCADCYTAFGKALAPLLDELHLCTDHAGDPTMARRREIAALKRELAEAVRREDYAAAKELKARLAALLAGEDGHETR